MRTILHFIFCVMLTTAWIAAQTDIAQAETFFLASDLYSPAKTNKAPTPDSAEQFFQQARKACEAGNVGLALQLATRAVVADPDHAGARRVLGYRRVGEHWAGSYAVRRLEREETWHSQFGWIKTADLPHFEAGERRLGKRWISAEDDRRRHATIDRGWQIRTDHFRVITNHSRKDASELAVRLEALYQVWQQLFGGFALKPADLLKRFDGTEIGGSRSKPFQVRYYRTRDEYNTTLLRQQPRIKMTLGIYFDTQRETHFFAGDQQDAGTIFHEAVHQFFYESGRPARNVAALNYAWLTEGVACYFESLVEHHDPAGQVFFTMGTPTAGRLPAARHRRLVDDFYVPLAELSSMGMKEFQRRTDLPRLYSQSAGLATFLIHAEDGKYRPALVTMLQRLYAGRDQVGTLEELTGRSFAELDREYLKYVESLPTAEAGSPLAP